MGVPKISWVLGPPTEGLLGGHWGEYQRTLYPKYYCKDGRLKWWAQLRWEKELKRRTALIKANK